MSFFTILYNILIGPLQMIFEMIYSVANQYIGHPGLAIIVLSLMMNILVLPLYKRSDAMQEEARDTEAKLSEGVAHIKKAFSGDERMMILQTYYRQNNYKPTDSLNGAVSLLLEVPFFMAAYNFLSHLELLQGVSLGPIADLSLPDGLLLIGGMHFNLLPILMTVINIVSSAIYLKGFPLKTKIQLYGMAIFFLVFLYTSPSGLVFYWTLNNVFSLCKNIAYKVKDRLVKAKKEEVANVKAIQEHNTKAFILGGLFLTILVGVLIPSTIISASPQEFIDITFYFNPMWYIANATAYAFGMFVVWMGVFYWISSPAGKAVFDKLMWILCGVMLVDYMFFGTDLGIIFANLQYETGLVFTTTEKILNLAVVFIVAVALYVVARKWKQVIPGVLITAVIAIAGMSVPNLTTINREVSDAERQIAAMSDEMPEFTLSKEGQNVIVFMIDRGMASYVPYMFNEKPELQEQFEGFKFYDNTISFGGYTNFGTPGLYGGYEYTPVEMNRRSDETLGEKHNEALKVLPVLFDENGYEVTVCDVPYAGYNWITDLSIYDEYEDIDTYITEGKFEDTSSKEAQVESNKRNFFWFGVMKSMPLCVQNGIYNNGTYRQLNTTSEAFAYSMQTIASNSVAVGMGGSFMKPYNVLVNLPNMTKISEDDTNTFLMMNNNTTHEAILIQAPEYVPTMSVDNTQYDAENTARFTVNGETLKMENPFHYMHYETNMAAFLQLGKWFDYMRENDVWDNTRIILVSDHGKELEQLDELAGRELYYALLMVKDFGSEEYTTSDEFMTNADVPTLAVEGVIDNPINPFTGKEINSAEKTAQDQYIIVSDEWDLMINNGNTFFPSAWYAVKDNIWENENWRFFDEATTIPSELVE